MLSGPCSDHGEDLIDNALFILSSSIETSRFHQFYLKKILISVPFSVNDMSLSLDFIIFDRLGKLLFSIYPSEADYIG